VEQGAFKEVDAMLLGTVIGTVVASQKERELEGLRLLLVKGADVEGKATGGVIVAADAVGAGVGELVLYCAGSSARQTEVTKNKPVDHVIMAIVDEIHVGNDLKFKKN
jgi:microcompartment protein CcmK/EutM